MDNIKQPIKSLKINSLNINTIFKFCPDGIVCKDKNLCYVESNESYNKTFALKHFNSLVGQKNNPYIKKNIMKLIQDADNEVQKSCNPINYVINIQNDKLLNITTFPILYKKEFIGLISIIKDITQEEAIKEDFVNKHFEYINSERKLQAQRETFVASLGHDLKNPTIAQIRSVELLLKGVFGKITPEQKEILEMVLDSCRYMNGMLCTLLATYRNDDGIIKLNYTDFSFSELVKECVAEMLYVAKDKGISIYIEDTLVEKPIQADRVQLKRVIMNLLSNGIKYAFPNSQIKLKIYSEKSLVCFESVNNSPYISEEKQKAIFAQYVSYASTHNELGTGLGLYASKKIIEAHNGTIFVLSETQEINTFGFKIPVIQKERILENAIPF